MIDRENQRKVDEFVLLLFLLLLSMVVLKTLGRPHKQSKEGPDDEEVTDFLFSTLFLSFFFLFCFIVWDDGFIPLVIR